MQYLEVFREYDMFGTTPTFYFNKKKKNGTIFGLLVTMLALFSYFTCGIYYISEMFDKSNVKSYTSVRNPTNPLSINFTSDKFYFGFAIQDPITYDFVRDESIYHVKASYKVATRQEDGNLAWEIEPVELEPCQLTKFNNKYKELFEKKNVTNLYCIKNFNYNIEGTFLHDKYSFITFDFYQCKNTTENGNKCKPQNKIDYYLNSTFVAIEFTDISLDLSNYTHPVTPIIGETYSTIGNNFYREMHIYLKSVLFKSDIGLLFTSIKEGNYLQLDYVNDMFALQVREMFCSFSLKISNKINIYERAYIKFQTTLVNIGGIIQGITTIGMVITFFYSLSSYDLALTNHIFNVTTNNYHVAIVSHHRRGSKDNKTSENSDTYQSSQLYHLKSKDGSTINKYSVPSTFKSQSSSNDESFLQKNIKYQPIQLSFITMCLSQILPRWFSKNSKAILLNKGTSIIEEQLDIITIVKESFNNMKIRKMLLSKIQYLLFNSNSNPELTLFDEKKPLSKLELEFKNIKAANFNIKRKMLDLLKTENHNKIINDSIFLSNFT